MMSGRSQEIERLYHEACTRDPSERDTFLDRACAGDHSLRSEVESLVAWRQQASGFLELSEPDPATEAIPVNDEPRRPWWVWCWSIPVIVAAAGIYFVSLTAPEAVGWRLSALRDDAKPAAYRVIAIAPGSGAERAAFEVGDLIAIPQVERFAREQKQDVSFRFDVIHAGRHRTRVLTPAPKHPTIGAVLMDCDG
jgi:hypothetical protein